MLRMAKPAGKNKDSQPDNVLLFELAFAFPTLFLRDLPLHGTLNNVSPVLSLVSGSSYTLSFPQRSAY